MNVQNVSRLQKNVQDPEENFDVDQHSEISESEIRENTETENSHREQTGTGLPHLQSNPFSLAGNYNRGLSQ